MAQPHQSVWSRLYRFCNDYPIVVFPLAVDLYRIVICKDYRRPTFTEFVLWIMIQCVCWSALLLTLVPIVQLAKRLLRMLPALAKFFRERYRNLEPSVRDALHRWNLGQDVAGWTIVTIFDWHSYAIKGGDFDDIAVAVICDTQLNTQPTEKIFYVQMTGIFRFFEQSLVDGAVKLLHVCPSADEEFVSSASTNTFYSNGTLVVLLLGVGPGIVPLYEGAMVTCYHVQSNQLWRARLPKSNEIDIRTTVVGIFSVSCDAQGCLASVHWSGKIMDWAGRPFRKFIRTDYYEPVEFQRLDDYYKVTLASRRTAEEIYLPDTPDSKTDYFRICASLYGLRTKYSDRRNEEWLVCNPYDTRNRYQLVKAVGWKELGYLCGPRQYKAVCEILASPLATSSRVIRESQTEILVHIGGFNVIRTTFGQVQQPNVQQTGSILFRLSAMCNEPPPATVQEYLVGEDDW